MHIDLRQKVFRDPWFVAGSTLAFLFAVATLLGPPLAPFDPWDMSFAPISAPSARHLLGVNDGGQDIFSELLFAVRNTVSFGLTSGLIALVIGVIIGLIAGWKGGLVDMILMRVADVLLAIPSIMILILTAALFRPSPWVLAFVTNSIVTSRMIKAGANKGSAGENAIVRTSPKVDMVIRGYSLLGLWNFQTKCWLVGERIPVNQISCRCPEQDRTCRRISKGSFIFVD